MEQAWSHSPAWGWGLPREGLSEPQLCPPRTEAQQEVGSTGPKHQAGWHPQRAEPTPAPLALMEVRFLAATSGGCPPPPFPEPYPLPSPGNPQPQRPVSLWVLGPSGLAPLLSESVAP